MGNSSYYFWHLCFRSRKHKEEQGYNWTPLLHCFICSSQASSPKTLIFGWFLNMTLKTYLALTSQTLDPCRRSPQAGIWQGLFKGKYSQWLSVSPLNPKEISFWFTSVLNLCNHNLCIPTEIQYNGICLQSVQYRCLQSL